MYNPAPKRFEYWEVFGVYVLRYHELFDWVVYLHDVTLPNKHAKIVIEAAGYNW